MRVAIAILGLAAWVAAFALDHVWAEDQYETLALRLSDEITAMVLLACGCAGYQWPRWRVIAVVAVAFVIPPIVADYAEAHGWEPLVRSDDPDITPGIQVVWTPFVMAATTLGLVLRRYVVPEFMQRAG
jgi:hypothetical protein